jgi:branched-chain amino acid transport system ATP-binding protein
MLNVTELVVNFGAVRAVRGLTLHVDAGEVVGMLGPNGAGKTSALQAISGLIPTAGGSVELAGVRIDKFAAAARVRAGLTLVPQGREVFPNLSVLDNLRAGAWQVPRARRIAQQELIADFPVLQQRPNQSAGTLSGGEQQMLALARGMASAPKIMLLDEPSMGLSPLMVDRVADAIMRMAAERGITMLVVDQGLGVVRKVSSRTYVMSHGQIVAELESADLEARTIQDAYFR